MACYSGGGFVEKGNEGVAAFSGLGEADGCFYFGKHGAFCELLLCDIFLCLLYGQVGKPFLIFFAPVDSYFFNCGQDDEVVGAKLGR